MKWQRFFDGKDTSHLRNIPYSMDMDKDGYIYVTGSTEKNWDTADYATIKYNSDGVEQWRRFFNSPDKRFDLSTGIKADLNGNCYVTGLTKKINGDFGITTVKYLSNGTQKWHNTIDGAVDVLQEEYPFIALNSSGDVFTGGTVIGSFNRLDFMTVKYKHENDTVIIEPVLPESYELKQNYPNPFNPETNIMFDLPEAAEVSIKIYNMNGRLVETFLEGFMEGGRRVLKWDASKYSSGIYFCRMDAGNYIQYMKMVYVK
jgi:hypothetical protein